MVRTKILEGHTTMDKHLPAGGHSSNLDRTKYFQCSYPLGYSRHMRYLSYNQCLCHVLHREYLSQGRQTERNPGKILVWIVCEILGCVPFRIDQIGRFLGKVRIFFYQRYKYHQKQLWPLHKSMRAILIMIIRKGHNLA